MKLFIFYILLLLTAGFSTPISSIPQTKYDFDSNVMYWAYSTEDNQYGLIYKFILLGNGGLALKKTKEDNPYDQLPRMKNCMDSTYNDAWIEFDKDISIGIVMTVCASRLGWMD